WVPSGPHGQQHWPEGHPSCGGRAQSPINIQTRRVQLDPSLPPIRPMGYHHPSTPTFTLANNGHTAVLALPPSLWLQGLPHSFAAAQLHFHWGRPGHASGAEHLLDGRRAPAEVWGGPEGGGPEGMGVPTDAPAWERGWVWEMAGELGWEMDLGVGNGCGERAGWQTTAIPSFSVQDLLPPRLDLYYRYNGSLTTPPCFQTVLWTLFQQPVHISLAQLEQLQGALYATAAAEPEPQRLVDNFRVPQELNQRRVLVSFPTGERRPLWGCTGEVITIVFGTISACLGIFLAVHFAAKRMR
ncbi:CAH14 anhydrase, partial [Podilymbus podiceps]|nr:CAH14 anhydrase [Podilymbus podiceps]